MKNAAKFRCDFSIGDSIGHAIIWVLLTIVTLGLALFVFPYYLVKEMVNKTTVLDTDGVTEIGKLQCEISLGTVVGHAFLSLLLVLITFGLAYVIYFYRVMRIVLSATTIEYHP